MLRSIFSDAAAVVFEAFDDIPADIIIRRKIGRAHV